MSKILMKDVGSAQHVLLWPENGKDSVVVDFGIGKDYPNKHIIPQCAPFPWPFEKLIISHFHEDHINGFSKILGSYPKPYCSFDTIYYPKMPYMANTNSVCPQLLGLLVKAISLGVARIFSQTQYSNLYNFLNDVIASNSKILRFIPVSRGCQIPCGQHTIEIMWPIQTTTTTINRKILDDINSLFQQALAQILPLNQIYSFANSTLISATESFQNEFVFSNAFLRLYTQALSTIMNNKLSKKQKSLMSSAQKKIKDVLNKWSIAFMTDDNILFLGDLMATQINNVCNNFIVGNKQMIDVLVAAHHGTHNGYKLKKLCAQHAIASIGNRLFGTKEEAKSRVVYSTIANTYATTHQIGDIMI